MRSYALLLLIVGAAPTPSLAGEPLYGVITSKVDASSIKGERVLLIPGEMVEVLPEKLANNLQVRSIYNERVVTVAKEKVALESDFLDSREWKGQRQFLFNNEVSAICTTTFDPNGAFSSTYDCNCEESKTTKGKLSRLGQLLWAKGACDSQGKISPLSVFVLKENGRLCQVEVNFEKQTSECYESYGQ